MNEPEKDKRLRGFFEEFNVSRTDGTSAPGEKHDGCQYFVLDLTHDPYALVAIAAYSKMCEKEYPKLAQDLDQLVIKRSTGAQR